LGSTRWGDKTCGSIALVSSENVQSPLKPFDRERSCAHPGTPNGVKLSRAAAEILRVSAKSRYMQQNGSKTLDVVGRAGQ
jgi:hypothetical protein